MSLLNHEIPLTLSPTLAQTIGLEEAILLPLLQQAQSFSQHLHCKIPTTSLLSKCSFWDANDIQRISKSLADKGLIQIHSKPFSQCQVFEFSFDETPSEKQASQPPKPIAAQAQGANRLSPHFKPNASTLAQLRQQGVQANFARAQLPEFIAYWTERGEISHAWNAKFSNHVMRSYQRNKAELPFAVSSEASIMQQSWQPSLDATDILKNIGIDPGFIDDSIPEFVLYWRERGDSTNTWNSKFIQHVKRQWAKFTSTLKYDNEPKQILASWQPEPEVFDIIAMANIDQKFAHELIQEFVLYWKESKQLHSSWNSKFLQHVKYRWAQQHQLQGLTHAGRKNTTGQSTATADFIDLHTDTSWAEGI